MRLVPVFPSGSGLMAGEGRLLTRYATTGWTDWRHGELWLFEDGLLYRSLGWPATLTNAFEKSVPLLARIIGGLGSENDESESSRRFPIRACRCSVRL